MCGVEELGASATGGDLGDVGGDGGAGGGARAVCGCDEGVIWGRQGNGVDYCLGV